MKRVLTAVVLVPLVLALLFKAPDWLYSGVIGLVAVLAMHEYFEIARHRQENLYLHWYVMLVATGLYFLGHSLHKVAAFGQDSFGVRFEGWTYDVTGIRVLPLLLLVLGLFLKDLRSTLPVAAISYFGFAYIAITLGEISLVGHDGNGRVLVFVFLLVVWSGDVFAYYVGRSLGQHKLAPTVSPGKTWEGAVASMLGAIVVSIVLFRYIHGIGNLLVKLDSLPSNSIMYADAPIYAVPLWLAAVFGACVNIAAQLGDLAESALKRGAGVKDSGTLLPGHGGVLDRIDAMLLAAPVLWFFHPALYKAIIHKP
jgi:phosphatidate cytidylyltransferase